MTAILTQPLIDVKKYANNPNCWRLGYDFMYANFKEYHRLYEYGRFGIILIGCFGAWFLYKFSLELFGFRGALLSLFLYVFNPNIIAHARLVTVDMGVTIAVLVSIYYFMKFTKKDNCSSALKAGVALGIAELCKFTALLLYPIYIFILSLLILKKINGCDNHDKKFHSILLQQNGCIIFLFIVSIVVINIGYFFSGTFSPIDIYSFSSEPLKKLSLFLGGSFIIPLPYAYIMGFDSLLTQSLGKSDFFASYLMGESALTGWWHYYLIAFIVKNPEVLSIIIIITCIIWFRKGEHKPDFKTSLCVWAPTCFYFLYFSFFTNSQIGLRYILMIFPLLFLAAGIIGNSILIKHKAGKLVLSVLLICYLVSSLAVFPNYLSYFNISSGGPPNGRYWLIDSNLDWGQDLPALKKYMKKQGITKINLGYFGRVDPVVYDINYQLAKSQPISGFHAISANFYVGRPYYLLEKESHRLRYINKSYFKKYRAYKPVASAGHSILIFNINDGSR